jgi:hypothetical protein
VQCTSSWYHTVIREQTDENSAPYEQFHGLHSIGACLPRSGLLPTDQYLQYGLFTARVLPMILLHPQLTHPSFEATIAFGRFVQRTSSTLKSHNTAFASRSIDGSIFHATMHARELHLRAVVQLASSNRRSMHPRVKSVVGPLLLYI